MDPLSGNPISRPAQHLTPTPKVKDLSVSGPKDGFSPGESAEVGLIQPVQLTASSADIGRPLTFQEKVEFKASFPKLNVNKATVTADATPKYNCISWTTGNTESWDWPPSMYPDLAPREAFDKYYSTRGFTKITTEQAAATPKTQEMAAYWEDPKGPTHGSISGPSHGNRWESKCGQAARITHEQNELVSNVYGEIKGFWLKTSDSTVPPTPAADPALSAGIQSKLETQISRVDEKVSNQFQGLYAQWLEHRAEPEVAISSNPRDYCGGEAFQALANLGPESLPLVIDKMARGDHFSQYLAQAISQKQDDFKLAGTDTPTLRAKQVDCGEQAKSRQVLEQWLKSDW